VAAGLPHRVLTDEALMERTGLEVPHSLRYHAAGIAHDHWAKSRWLDAQE